MVLTTLLLSSWLAVQEPPKPPPAEPPRAGDAARDASKGAAQIDVELRAALDELRRANGYRIEIDGTMAGGDRSPVAGKGDAKKPDPQRDEQGDKGGEKGGEKSGAGEEKVALAKEAPVKRESFHGTGAFERDKPVQFKSDRLEAFRSSRKLIWRSREQKEWSMVPARVGEPPRPDSGAEAVKLGGEGDAVAPVGDKSADDTRVAAMLANLPLPDDLSHNDEARLVSCQRSTGADVKGGMATYDSVLGPSPEDKKDGKSDGRNCSLRFTVTQGRIAEIDWRHPAERASSDPQPPAAAAGGPSILCHFMLSEFGGTQVTVPEDVARILAER